MNTTPPERVLVTGGAGFIGSHLVDALLDAGTKHVTVVDTYFLGSDENLEHARNRYPGALDVYREDAGDHVLMSEIIERSQPDVVFNLATKALLYSFLNPSGACQVNLSIALTLCELLRKECFGRLVHVSSSEVYGSARYVPMDEEHPLLAETTYAAGKAAADLAVASYVRMFDLDAVTVRPFNNYGPRQNEGLFAAVVPLTIMHILRGEQPIVQGDGRQTRDLIYVEDTVQSIIASAMSPCVRGQTLNVASGTETAIGELVELICTIMEWGGGISYEATRTADVKRHLADVSRAKELLGTPATTPLPEGIRQTVRWYVDQEHRQ